MWRTRAEHGEDRCPPVDSDAVDTLARAARSIRHGTAAPARRLLPALVAGLLLGLVAAGPALGHAELEQSMPEDGEVPAAPSASPVATPSATPAPSPSADTTPVASGGTDVLLPIIAALAILGVVAYLVLRRGRTA